MCYKIWMNVIYKYVPNGLIYLCQCNLKSKLNTLSIQPFKDWRYYMFISTQSDPQMLYHFVGYLIFKGCVKS